MEKQTDDTHRQKDRQTVRQTKILQREKRNQIQTLFDDELAIHLEPVLLDDALLYVLLDLPDDGQHGNIGLAGASRRTYQQILIGVVRSIKHNRLNPVQLFGSLEGCLPNLQRKNVKYLKLLLLLC